MKGFERKVQVGDTEVTVRELSVAETRNWLKGLESAPGDIVGDMLFEEFSLHDIAIMTGLQPVELDAMTPSQIRTVWEACREVNADFFRFRTQLTGMGAELMKSASVA